MEQTLQKLEFWSVNNTDKYLKAKV